MLILVQMHRGILKRLLWGIHVYLEARSCGRTQGFFVSASKSVLGQKIRLINVLHSSMQVTKLHIFYGTF